MRWISPNISGYGGVALRWAGPKQFRQVRLIAESGLFDGAHYIGAERGSKSLPGAIYHFLNHGAAKGHDPNPLFSTAWYLTENPDVAASGLNPLVHYICFGASEGRRPHPLFDGNWYFQKYDDVARSGQNPLAHYLRFGVFEGRQPHPWFDVDWYLAQQPDLGKSCTNPLIHYLTFGARRGYDPHPTFSTNKYLDAHPECLASGANPLIHFLSDKSRHGQAGANTVIRSGASSDDLKRLIIVDPSLDGFVGHHFDYDSNISNAARNFGYMAMIFAKRQVAKDLNVRPNLKLVFRRDMWSGSSTFPDWSEEDILICNKEFYVDLIHALRDCQLGKNTTIFGHMVTSRQLMGWAWFAERYLPTTGAKLILLLRYDLSAYQGTLAFKAFRRLECLARSYHFGFTTDSANLACDFVSLTSLPFVIAPIPVTPLEGLSLDRVKAAGPRRFRFTVLGNARKDKGILDVFSAIKLVYDSGISEFCEFDVQCNDPEPGLTGAICAFDELQLPNVRLFRAPLSTRDYADLLFRSDAVLLPYWASVYKSRTSGVFAEAVCAGKPVICSKNTWMAEQLVRYGSGILCEENNPTDLARSIKSFISNADNLFAQAVAKSASYAAFHSSENFIRTVIES